MGDNIKRGMKALVEQVKREKPTRVESGARQSGASENAENGIWQEGDAGTNIVEAMAKLAGTLKTAKPQQPKYPGVPPGLLKPSPRIEEGAVSLEGVGMTPEERRQADLIIEAAVREAGDPLEGLEIEATFRRGPGGGWLPTNAYARKIAEAMGVAWAKQEEVKW